MSKYTAVKLNDFTAGENKTASPDNLSESEVRHMENVDPLLRGGIRPRGGTAEYLTTTYGNLDRIIQFEYSNASGVRVLKELGLSGGNLINLADDSVIKTGLDSILDYEVMDNKIYIISNGLFFYYDGTAVTDVTTTDTPAENMLPDVKKCKYIEQRGERLFASGNPEEPSYLYYSAVLDPSAWYTPTKVDGGGNSMGVNPIRAVSDDGDPITGLREFHGALLVFKTRHIHAWYGYDPMIDVEFKQLDVQSGTISNRSIVKVDNFLFYMGAEGVWALKGTETNVIVTYKISKNIKPLLDDINIVTPYYNNPIVAIVYNDKYFISVPTGTNTTNDRILVFHFNNWQATSSESWSHYTGLEIKDSLISYDNELLALIVGTGTIVECSYDYTNDRGVLIATKVQFRPFGTTGIDAFMIKKYRGIIVLAKQFDVLHSTFKLSGYVDYTPFSGEVETDESGIYGEGLFDASVWDFSELVSRYTKVGLKGKRLDITIETDTLDETFLIYAIGVIYKSKKLDKRENN